MTVDWASDKHSTSGRQVSQVTVHVDITRSEPLRSVALASALDKVSRSPTTTLAPLVVSVDPASWCDGPSLTGRAAQPLFAKPIGHSTHRAANFTSAGEHAISFDCVAVIMLASELSLLASHR